MNRAWKHLSGNILYGADPAKVGLEEIDLLLNEYPYFAALHFMKASKLEGDGSGEALQAKSKAALYFHNPHWFKVLLTSQDQVRENSDSLADIMTTRVSEEFQNMDVEDTVLPPAEMIMEDNESAYDDKRVETTTEYTDHPLENQQDVEWVSAAPQEYSTDQVEATADRPQQVEDSAVRELEPTDHRDIPTSELAQLEQPSLELPVEQETEQAEAGDILTSELAPVEQASQEPDKTPNEVQASTEPNWHIEEPAEATPVFVEFDGNEVSQHLPVENISDEEAFEQVIWNSRDQEVSNSTELPPSIDEPPAAEEMAAPEPHAPLKILFKEPSEESQLPEIPFEPLYTIDYFASQGIKFNTEGKDQLSIKMKSFTEWLRSMKRLHPEKIEHNLPKEEEAHIRETAETSNAAQHIVTEAMAEVYIKQGKKERAIELLEKLSLLDPSKSAYFAVRIKEIKEN